MHETILTICDWQNKVQKVSASQNVEILGW